MSYITSWLKKLSIAERVVAEVRKNAGWESYDPSDQKITWTLGSCKKKVHFHKK